MNNKVFDPFEIDFIYKDQRANKPSLHTHHRYEVFYFHSGKCNYLIGSNIYMLEPGDILLMNGMTLHSPKVDLNDQYVRSIVHFEHEGITPFLHSLHSLNVLKPFQEYNNYRLSLRGCEKEEVECILQRMAHYFEKKDTFNYNRFRLNFIDLLYVIFDQFQSSTEIIDKTKVPNNKENCVQRIITYLEENYEADITLETLQSHLHVNKFYLTKLFKQITGTTIMTFLYEYRINEAKKMFLLDKDISVTTVSYKVGFKHLSHFSRLFKQHVGISPEAFKKMYGM
ncbi:AraC family transcriptional regulator [Peribacillus simplex]|uniref:AraC family transcriptional regulator n=1 Tax=Peribacillus simplex TaxID=1478 RepID=UPI0038090C3D